MFGHKTDYKVVCLRNFVFYSIFLIFKKEIKTVRIYSCYLDTDNNIKKCTDVHSIKLCVDCC